MFVNDGSRSMQFSKQIGHFVNEGDRGLTLSGEALCRLVVVPPLALETPHDDDDDFLLLLLLLLLGAIESFDGRLRFERFSSCDDLRSGLSLVKSEPCCCSRRLRFE